MGWESNLTRQVGADAAAAVGQRARYEGESFIGVYGRAPTRTSAPPRHEFSFNEIHTQIPPQVAQWHKSEPRPLQPLITQVSSLVSSAPGPLGLAQLMHGAATHSLETHSGTRFSVPQLLANAAVAEGRDLLLERGVLHASEADSKPLLGWSELSSPDNLLAAALGIAGWARRTRKRVKIKKPSVPEATTFSPTAPQPLPQKPRFPKEQLNKLQIQLREVKFLEEQAYQALRKANALLDPVHPNSPEYEMLSRELNKASNKWAKHQSQKLALMADIERMENWINRFRP